LILSQQVSSLAQIHCHCHLNCYWNDHFILFSVKHQHRRQDRFFVCLMVFNATFNNISVIAFWWFYELPLLILCLKSWIRLQDSLNLHNILHNGIIFFSINIWGRCGFGWWCLMPLSTIFQL
jgi:hypothetical protein